MVHVTITWHSLHNIQFTNEFNSQHNLPILCEHKTLTMPKVLIVQRMDSSPNVFEIRNMFVYLLFVLMCIIRLFFGLSILVIYLKINFIKINEGFKLKRNTNIRINIQAPKNTHTQQLMNELKCVQVHSCAKASHCMATAVLKWIIIEPRR